MSATKPDCYWCVYRRPVPDSAHSACVHPATAATSASPYMQLAARVGKRGGPLLLAMADEYSDGPSRPMRALHIQAAPMGVMGGWFVWPVNFDPTWLEHCDGFTAMADAATPAADEAQS